MASVSLYVRVCACACQCEPERGVCVCWFCGGERVDVRASV